MHERLLRLSLPVVLGLLAVSCSVQAPPTPSSQATAATQSTEADQAEPIAPGDEAAVAVESFPLPVPATRAPAPSPGPWSETTAIFAETTSDPSRIDAAFVEQGEIDAVTYFHGQVDRVRLVGELDSNRFVTTGSERTLIWERGRTAPLATLPRSAAWAWMEDDGRIYTVTDQGARTVFDSATYRLSLSSGSLEVDEVLTVLHNDDDHLILGTVDEELVFAVPGSSLLYRTGVPSDDDLRFRANRRPNARLGPDRTLFLKTTNESVMAFTTRLPQEDPPQENPWVVRTPQGIVGWFILDAGRLVTTYETGGDVWDPERPGQSISLDEVPTFTDYLVELPGSLVATASVDKTLRIWDFDNPTDPLLDSVVMPKDEQIRWLVALAGNRVATIGTERNVHIWNVDDLSKPLMSLAHDQPPANARQLDDGSLVVQSVSRDLYVWDLDNPAVPTILRASNDEFAADYGLLSDGSIYRATHDGSVELFTRNDSQLATSDSQWHTQPVEDLLWLSDGRLVSTGSGGEIFVWDISGSRPPLPLVGHEDAITMIVEHRGTLVSASIDGTIRQWDLNAGAESARIQTSGPVMEAQVLPDGAVVTGTNNGELQIWRLDDASATGSGIKPRTVAGHSGAVVAMQLLSDGRIVTAGRDHRLVVWNPRTWESMSSYTAHDTFITAIEELADRRLATGDLDGGVHVWDPQGEQEPIVLVENDGVRSIQALDSGRLFVATDGDLATVWDPSGGAAPARFDGMALAVALADGRILGVGAEGSIIAGSANGTTELVALPERPTHLDAYDAGRLAVAAGQNVLIVNSEP